MFGEVMAWCGEMLVNRCRILFFLSRSGGYLFLDWRLVRIFRYKACSYPESIRSNK